MKAQLDLPTRRTVTKGAAWVVPAVTVVAAAPALAASPTCEFGLDAVATYTFADPSGMSVRLDVTLRSGACSDGAVLGAPLSVSFTLPSTNFTGAWDANYDITGVTPSEGSTGTLSYVVTTTHVFSSAGDAASWPMYFSLQDGARITPISFTFSATDVEETTSTWSWD